MKRIDIATLPPEDEPVADLISRKITDFKRAEKRKKAERWLPVRFAETSLPFGVLWFGDPHLDDNYCNWPLLLEHVELSKQPGVYAACVGDYRNNWVGRLAALYADQRTTNKEGRQLAEWFLREAGVPWFLCVLGNHDLWNEGKAITGMIAANAVYVPSWEARVELQAGKQSWRVHVAHDFKGNSEINGVHGPMKHAMRSGLPAELYVCGHKHHPAGGLLENAEQDRVARIVRTRGYKWFDEHATVNGFPQGTTSAAVLTIFNPRATHPAGRVLTFEDPATGVEVLQAMRRVATKR